MVLNHLAFASKLFSARSLAFILLVSLLLLLAGQPVLAAATAAEPAGQEQPVAARLAAGLQHSAMINYDGKLYVWGDNTFGQLGLGTLDYSDSPQLVGLPGQVAEVSLGTYHTLAVMADGSVYAFGRNAFGQLGTGNTENADRPVLVEGLPPIKAVAAGSWHSLALGEDGSVWAWGNNTNFQVGPAASEVIKDTEGKVLGTRCLKPIRIINEGAVAIAAGGQFSMYLDDSGRVLAWGDNSRGQLGDGTTEARAQPKQIFGLDPVTAIAAGYEHCLALSRQQDHDSLYTWGDDSLGQLGIGSDPADGIYRSLPQRLDVNGDQDPLNDQVVLIQAGYSQSAITVPAVLEKGEAGPAKQQLLVWGNNSAGQLGLGQTGSQIRPKTLNGTFDGWTGDKFLPFDAIAFGGYHLLVLSSKGLLAGAGQGERGQLGNFSVLNRNQLTAIDMPDVIRPGWLEAASLSAQYNEGGDLVVRWPAAQDNRVVAGYLVRMRTSDDKVRYIDAKDQLFWVFSGIAPNLACEITVMPYDSESSRAQASSLSYLAGYALPADAGAGSETLSDYFPEMKTSVWRAGGSGNHWVPDPRGLVQPLELPWNASSIYGQKSMPRPAIWREFTYMAWGTGLLFLLVIIDMARRHSRKKKRLLVSRVRAGSYQQAG